MGCAFVPKTSAYFQQFCEAKKRLSFYEVTRFTDDVKRIKKQADNLYLVNYANTAFSKLLFSGT